MVDAAERLEVLLQQEASHYLTEDYLSRIRIKEVEDEGGVSPSCNKKRKSLFGAVGNNCNDDETPSGATANRGGVGEESVSSQINKQWREKICEWAYQVVDHFDLHREVVSIAMSHLDRYLAAFDMVVDKNLFHLLSMTCLYLSIKLNEYKHLLIPGSTSSMDTILQLSRGLFTLQHMERMEYDVLQRLQWHVHPPTPQLFVKHFLFLFSVEQHEINDLAQFMVELSVMDYFFVPYKPSEVAMAALLNAMDRLYPQGTYHLDLPFESQYFDMNSSNVQACRERLALIYAQASDDSANRGPASSTAKGTAGTTTACRTTSPVSVMDYESAQQMDVYSMETADDVDDDL